VLMLIHSRRKGVPRDDAPHVARLFDSARLIYGYTLSGEVTLGFHSFVSTIS